MVGGGPPESRCNLYHGGEQSGSYDSSHKTNGFSTNHNRGDLSSDEYLWPVPLVYDANPITSTIPNNNKSNPILGSHLSLSPPSPAPLLSTIDAFSNDPMDPTIHPSTTDHSTTLPTTLTTPSQSSRTKHRIPTGNSKGDGALLEHTTRTSLACRNQGICGQGGIRKKVSSKLSPKSPHILPTNTANRKSGGGQNMQ